MPTGSISLIGGTIRRLDRVRDRITVQVFGGASAVLLFDPRTHVYRDGRVATLHDLQLGQRIYADTLLDGTQVFAKNIRIVSTSSMGQSNGQVVEHEPGSAELTVRDVLSPEPMRLRLDDKSVVTRDGQPVSAVELLPGTLVSVDFRPDGRGQGAVRTISILAVPGSVFSFAGRLAHLDLSQGLLVVVDPRDHQSYEIHCDASLLRAHPDVREGAQVTITATFNGSAYTVKTISAVPPER
jgi:hypothetical protein